MVERTNADSPQPRSLHEAILETTVDAIISIDEYGVILSFNRAASAMFGYARDEVIGQNVSMLMKEPELSGHDSYLSRYKRTAEARIIGVGRDVEGRRKDGSTVPLNLAVSQAVDGEGNKIYAGILRDLSAKRETEHSALQREERYRALVQNAPIGIAISDEHRRISEANDALAAMLGIPKSEVIGKRLSDFEPDRSKRSGGGRFRSIVDRRHRALGYRT